MPAFGERSRLNLATCHVDLQHLGNELIKHIDVACTAGHRGQQAQHEAFIKKASQLDWPRSRHNRQPSEAVHFVPWIGGTIPWKLIKSWYHLGGYIRRLAEEMDINVRWGGDWDRDYDVTDQQFNDLAHWELVNGSQ